MPTIRNTAGVDLIAVTKAGTLVANIQVKTPRSKATFWPISKHYEKWVGQQNYYVFVRFLKRERRFEAFLEKAGVVAAEVTRRAAEDRARGLKKWAPCWYLPDDADRLKKQWEDLASSADTVSANT